MTPIYSLAERLLSFRQVERTSSQQLQRALQPIQNGPGGQNFGAGRRQLDRQGQSI
jgi:hypothetical protein